MRGVPFVAPDVLVLGAGGVLGEAWLTGVLAGIEDAASIDLRHTEHFVGTSAGSIVATQLAAGGRLRRPSGNGGGRGAPGESAARGLGRGAGSAGRLFSGYALAAAAPFASLGIAAATPGAALGRAALLRALPRPHRRLTDLRRQVGGAGVTFDGRLRICVVDRASGKRVVLGAPGAPAGSVADAVAASCAVPWIFAPVRIGGREYVDGGVWSPTNLDAAPARRDTHVLCLTPTGGAATPSSVWSAVRAAGRAGAEIEALTLRRRGARVRVIGPDRDASAVMGDDFMSPGPSRQVLAAGYAQGRRVVNGA